MELNIDRAENQEFFYIDYYFGDPEESSHISPLESVQYEIISRLPLKALIEAM